MTTRILFFAGIVFVLCQLFLNCSGTGFGVNSGFEISSETVFSSSAPPLGEPSAKTQAPSNKNNLVPRSYVIGLLQEVFSSPNYPVEGLEGTLRDYILNKPGSFGGNCDLNSSETGKDCGGDIANSTLSPLASSSTLRVVSLSTACENILSNDNAVRAVLEKIGVNSELPGAQSIGKLYSLFRRGWDPDSNYTSALLQMDRNLSQQKVSDMDRWRLQILMICEDPVWQSL